MSGFHVVMPLSIHIVFIRSLRSAKDGNFSTIQLSTLPLNSRITQYRRNLFEKARISD